MQPLHPGLQGVHQDRGLLRPKPLSVETQRLTPDTSEEAGRVTASQVPDVDTPRHKGGQRGQMLQED